MVITAVFAKHIFNSGTLFYLGAGKKKKKSKAFARQGICHWTRAENLLRMLPLDMTKRRQRSRFRWCQRDSVQGMVMADVRWQHQTLDALRLYPSYNARQRSVLES